MTRQSAMPEPCISVTQNQVYAHVSRPIRPAHSGWRTRST